MGAFRLLSDAFPRPRPQHGPDRAMTDATETVTTIRVRVTTGTKDGYTVRRTETTKLVDDVTQSRSVVWQTQRTGSSRWGNANRGWSDRLELDYLTDRRG